MSAYLHSDLCALAQARPTHVLHVPSTESMKRRAGDGRTIIGASLSEPHIDEKYMRDSYIYIYIYIYCTSVTCARRLIQNV